MEKEMDSFGFEIDPYGEQAEDEEIRKENIYELAEDEK